MMGSNKNGQLGIGRERESAAAPCLVESLRDYRVLSVKCGHDFSVAIVQDVNANLVQLGTETGFDSIYSWGDNNFGQLGHPQGKIIETPTKIDALEDVNISAIDCGFCHTFFVTEEGQVFACGINENGELGIDNREGFVDIPQLVDSIQEKTIV